MAGRSVNKVMLIGNVGADPEIRTTTGGGRVANFSLATSRSWSGASGDKQEKTEWHKCVVWNTRGTGGTGLADVVEKYVKKGERIYVEGRIEYRSYQDKENQTRYVTEINVRELMLLGTRGGPGGGGGGDSETEGSERSTRSGRGGAGRSGDSGGGRGDAGKSEEFEDIPGALADADDDLPF